MATFAISAAPSEQFAVFNTRT